MADKLQKYPLAPREEWYGEANYQETGGRLVEMTPDEFLTRVRPLKIDEISRDNIDDLKSHMESGRTLDPLQIYKEGIEDGRHRAHAARELGIEKVPVLTWDIPDEPRPPDQPNLPALLGPPEEPRPKGKLRRGIGSLRRAPWFALAQMAWPSFSPEQRKAAEDYAKQAYGSLEAGVEAAQAWTGRRDFPEGGAGGLEWVKDLLGFGDQKPSGIMSLPDLQKYAATDHGGLSSGIGSIELVGGTGRSIKAAGELSKGGQKHRVAKLKKELGSLIGTPVKGRTNTIKVSKAVDKARKTMTELEQRRMDGLIGDIDDLRDSIGPPPRFAPGWSRQDSRGDPSLIDPPADLFQAVDKLGATVRARGGDTVPTAYERLASASPNEIKFINEALKQRFGKGLLEFDIPQFGRRDLLLLGPSPEALLRTKLRLILRKDWQGKASGGMVSKPLYDNLIAPSRGSFIDKPLYEGAY